MVNISTGPEEERQRDQRVCPQRAPFYFLGNCEMNSGIPGIQASQTSLASLVSKKAKLSPCCSSSSSSLCALCKFLFMWLCVTVTCSLFSILCMARSSAELSNHSVLQPAMTNSPTSSLTAVRHPITPEMPYLCFHNCFPPSSSTPVAARY